MTVHNRNNYAFIDSQNLNLSIQDQGWKLNFLRFRKYLDDKCGVRKAFIFIGYVATNKSLYTALQEYGYIIIFKPTLILPTGKPKGNIDAELVLHSMIEYSNYDKAIVVSGDGDFYCLIEYFVRENKLQNLIIPNKYDFSSLLRRFNAYIIFMNGLKEKLEFRKK
jgi:uncharacterized LabA/DUF88 family protein